MYSDGGFAAHAKSEGPTSAMRDWAEYEKTMTNKSSPLSTLNEGYSKQAKENREYIKNRNLSGMEDNVNKGNFHAILDLISKHGDNLKTNMTKQQKATYTGHAIQNKILEGLADIVCPSIIKEIKEHESIDETKEMSKKDQMSPEDRYYSGSVQESFLYFEAAEQLDAAAAFSEKIIQILQNLK